ncbi:hypothetical protein V8F06_001110 [Rhypophila decipiens]
MRASLSVGQLAVALLSLTPVVSASRAWPKWFPEMDELVARQEASVSRTGGTDHKRNCSTIEPTPTPTSEPPKTTSTKKGGPIMSDFNTAGRTQSGDPEETGGSKTTGKDAKATKPPKHTQYPPQDPPGNVVMTKPTVFDPSSIYKIGGDPITWGWNYTNLQGQPSAIDVLISCAAVSRTWTLTQNMTFTTAASYTFDTKKYKEDNPKDSLRTDVYKLLIHDSAKDFKDMAEPGYLAPFSGFQFGLYEPQEYISFAEGWQCATCSGAMSPVEKRAVGGAVVMSVVTVLSFTWFVVGFGGGLL